MSEIKKYTPNYTETGRYLNMVEHEAGKYVLHIDYEAMKAERDEIDALRERVDALEWLLEVEDAKDTVYWMLDSSEDSWDEYLTIHYNARLSANAPLLSPNKVTAHAMGVKE